MNSSLGMPRAFISYEVVTAAGAPIRTFNNRDAALTFADDAVHTYPGLRVERVSRHETRVQLSLAPLQMVGVR